MVYPSPRSPASKEEKKFELFLIIVQKYRREWLNKHLLQGPDITCITSLSGILSRFYKEDRHCIHVQYTICFTKLAWTQRAVIICFLWWDESELGNFCDYRMTVHLFGAKSSPACVNCALTVDCRLVWRGILGVKLVTSSQTIFTVHISRKHPYIRA